MATDTKKRSNETESGEKRDVEIVANRDEQDGEEVIQRNVRDLTGRKRTEEVLPAGEQRFRALFELGPVAVYSCDVSGVIQEFNRRAAELWGRSPALGDTDERFCGSFKMRRLDGSFMAHEDCPMAEVLAGKIPEAKDAEVLIERPDGSQVVVIVNIRPLKNERGEITGAINCFYDVTERKQAELLMASQKQVFEMAAAGAPLMQALEVLARGIESQSRQGALVAIHLLDESGARFEQVLAPSLPAAYRQAVVGMEISSATGPCCAAISAREAVIVADVAASGQFTKFAAFASALGIRAACSTPILSSTAKVLGTVALYYREAREPHPQDNLLVEVVTRTATIIIERKQADEARARLAAIVDSSDDAIVSKDLNGVITSWNAGAERLFGYTAEETIGQPVTMLFPPDRLEEEAGILQRIRRGERIGHYETIRRRKDGTLFDVSLTVSPIVDHKAEVVGASKIARDISERRKAEEALRQAQAQLADRAGQLEQAVAERTTKLQETMGEIEAFSYSIVHDMRAPLRAMIGFAETLAADCGENVGARGQDYIRRITTSAHRMDRLIQDVLTYSRITRSELILVPVDLENLLRGMLESYPAFQPPNAEIEVQGPLLPVMGNEAALTQCLSNLLTNAVKFVSSGTRPRIRVWTETRGQRVLIFVQDNGIGIAKAAHQKIFGIFQRLSSRFEGTGIGLSIVQKAVERMGGKVGLQSEPGQGCTFWLELNGVAAERENGV